APAFAFCVAAGGCTMGCCAMVVWFATGDSIGAGGIACLFPSCVLSASFRMPVSQPGNSPSELDEAGGSGADGDFCTGAAGDDVVPLGKTTVASSCPFAPPAGACMAPGCCATCPICPIVTCSGGSTRVVL